MGKEKIKLEKGEVFIGTGSRWQNPFTFTHDPETELQSFQRWFHSEAYAATRLRKKVEERLFGKKLLCDCNNEQHCHNQVYLNYLNRTTNINSIEEVTLLAV